MLDGVGVGLAEVEGDGVVAGESPGDVVGCALEARGIGLQRGTGMSRALRRRAMMRSRHMSYAQSETANSIRTTLGALLRQRRDEAERSLTEVAASAGLSAAYLSEVERGLKDISTEKLIALTTALELSAADLYLKLARQLGSREAIQQQRSWPDDPRMQLRIATASLRPHALRSVADFSVYLAATQATPPRRRIGFMVDR